MKHGHRQAPKGRFKIVKNLGVIDPKECVQATL
jgi:hypothetical protein